MGYVASRFANSIDTIQVALEKIPLMYSSANSRAISTPALISINENKNVPEDAKFKKKNIPVAYLLEGKFSSLYRNRHPKVSWIACMQWISVKAKLLENKMIIVGDGDMF